MGQKKAFPAWLLAAMLALSACTGSQPPAGGDAALSEGKVVDDADGQAQSGSHLLAGNEGREAFCLEDIPPYDGEAGIPINGGIPFFCEADLTTEPFEEYSDLDGLGRCGAAFANVCRETMPTEERGKIGNIKPTGWHTVKYDVITDRYLYNRCHLIGFQLAGENANEKNLITGTRYLNVEGMLPWENMVAEYAEGTGNHVLYRVTPYFEGENLVASGVLMEAWSVEDGGAGVCFNEYCYNVQPGVVIDYATGESWLDELWTEPEEQGQSGGYDYVLNTNTKRFHDPACASVGDMSSRNKEYYTGEREKLLESGYKPCGRCSP